jgi:hypothetical protein
MSAPLLKRVERTVRLIRGHFGSMVNTDKVPFSNTNQADPDATKCRSPAMPVAPVGVDGANTCRTLPTPE